MAVQVPHHVCVGESKGVMLEALKTNSLSSSGIDERLAPVFMHCRWSPAAKMAIMVSWTGDFPT